jgi:hypothetical protein
MSAKDIKVLFKTTVSYVQLKGTMEMKIRAGDITIPSKVAKEISAIFGLHGLPLPKQSKFIALKSGGGIPSKSNTNCYWKNIQCI